ncbi:MAG TPA: hypothetical protein VFT29_08180 [Gemmatimonadaceae bacterium]|nr:hypothetical protein [Gemmatimonadaceae bacterium]
MHAPSRAPLPHGMQTVIGLALTLATACASDRPIAPATKCSGASADLSTLAVFDGATVRGSALECIRLAENAEYIVVPQLLGATLPYVYQKFLIGAPDATISTQPMIASLTANEDAMPSFPSTQERLHGLLRERERLLRPRRTAEMRVEADVADPVSRDFSVLASLSDVTKFAKITTALRFAGTHVLLYVDERTASIYTDDELLALGKQFDEQLYGVDHAAFGPESDIDGNGKVIVLFTPAVNALVSASECATFGFATGFFYGFDLASTAPESNKGEVFYAMTPDPQGTYSCAHTEADVAALLPATFVHEFQHMISYGQHVLAKGLPPEVPWLNEGLSHMAEELASLYYEARYPPPSGRTNPLQIFPDSASPLIIGNLFNSYRYLRFSEQYSISSCAPGSFCATPERGGAWLFLRWLADDTADPRLFEKLVQASDPGTENIEQATGRTFGDLFGEFALAVWGDSIVGAPRTSTRAALRFSGRNLRRIYNAMYETYGPLRGVPQRFPVSPIELDPATRREGAMRPGSFQVFHLRTPANHSGFALGLTSDSGEPLSAAHGAQVSILRVPLP